MKKKILKTVTPTLLAVSMVVNGVSTSALAAEPDVNTNSSADDFVFEDEPDSEDTPTLPREISALPKASESNATRSEDEGVETPDGVASILLEEDYVAMIDEDGYTSLHDAIAGAQEGDIITLKSDITLDAKEDITKKITLDLNDRTITVNQTGKGGAGCRGLGIAYTDVTFKNGTISSTVASENDTLVLVAKGKLVTENMRFETNDGTAITLYQFSEGDDAEVTLSADSSIENENGEGIAAYGSGSHHTINVEGQISVHGSHPAVTGNYQNAGTNINIKSGAKITGEILQMSAGSVVIEGGATIENPNSGSAIAITKGSLTINDGATISATSDFEDYQPSANGHVSDGGSAIFIEPTGNIDVTIEGGEISSVNGAAVYAPKSGNDGLSLEIVGGSFTGNEEKGAVDVVDQTGFIYGGSYSSDVSDYVDSEMLEVKSSDTYYVGDAATEALESAEAGETFTVLQSDGYDIHVPDGVIVENESGDVITVNGNQVNDSEQSTAHTIATVDDVPFDNLQSAVYAAQGTDDPVVIKEDINENTLTNISITDDVVIDLNTHTVTFGGTNTYGFAVFGGHAEFKNGTIKQTVTGDSQPSTIYVFGNGQNSSVTLTDVDVYGEDYSTIVLNSLAGYSADIVVDKDSTVTNTTHAIAGFYGGNHKVDVYGTVTASGTYSAILGAYDAGPVDITIHDDAVVNGQVMQMSPGTLEVAGDVTCEKGSAVSATNGSVTIKDTANLVSKFQADGDWKPSADGHVYDDGSALFIEGADSVTIEGGVFNSYHTAAVSGHKTESTNIEIKGGTFKNVQGQKSVSIDSEKKFISGGTFFSDIKEYVAENSMELQLKKSGQTAKYYVGPEAEEALASAQLGDVVTFEQMGESTSVEVPNGVTVQNNAGVDITVNGETLQNGHRETVVTDPAELSWTVTDKVTNHWEKFDNTFANSFYVQWIIDGLGTHAGPEGEIQYQIAIKNAEDHMASDPFEVKVTLPEGAFSGVEAKHPSSEDGNDLVVDLESNTITWKNVTVEQSVDKEATTVLTFTATVKDHPTVDKFDISYTINGQTGQYNDGPNLVYGAVYDPNEGQIDSESTIGVYMKDGLGGFTLENGVVKASIEQMKSDGNWNTPEKQGNWEHVVLAGWSYSKTDFQTTEKPKDLITDEFEFNGNIKLYAVWAADKNDNEIPDFDETADFSELQKAIQKANDLNEDDYKDLAGVQAAVASAENLMTEKQHIATEQEIQAAITAIEEAIEAAKLDFSALQNAKDEADGKQRAETDYTTSTWNAYASALEKANEMLTDHSKANHDQDTIDGLVTELTGSETALKKRADFTALDEAIEEAEKKINGKTEDDFDGDWSSFQDAYKAAKALADQYPEENRADISEDVNSALTDAAESLKRATEGIVEKEPDLAGLDEEIRKAEALVEDDYEDFLAVEAALSKANDLKGKPGVSATEVRDAINELIKATRELKKLDFAKLEEAVEDADDGKDSSAYTADSFSAYDAALKEAKAMVQDHSKANHSQDQIDALTEKLNTASAGLKESADFTALETAIQDAEAKAYGKTEVDFTETYKAFKEALDAAKKFMDDHPADTRANMEKDDYASEIERLTSELTSAARSLVEKQPIAGAADYTAYNAALSEANAAVREDYDVTDEQWNAFKAKIDEIDKTLSKNLTSDDQKTVDDAVQAVKDAIASLGAKVEHGEYVIDVILVDTPEETTGIPLQGVKFGFYPVTGNETASTAKVTAVSGADGKVKVTLPFGQYIVKYISGPTGYNYLYNDRLIVIDRHEGGHMDWIAYRNGSPVENRLVTVTVVDEDGKALPNISVRVRNSSIDRFYTTDSDGKLVIKDLTYGVYQISLATVPGGYVLDTTAKEITVTESADVIVPTFVVKKVKTPTPSGGSSSSSGGSSGGHYSSSSSVSTRSTVPAGAVTGTWTYDTSKDKWTFNDYQYKNQWVYIYNPYATPAQGQVDWFYFDANGEMVTGWFTDKDGLVYYLHETSDGTRGAMETGWVWIGGKCYYFHEVSDGTKGHLLKSPITPDGYAVNADGAWIVNRKVIEQ